MVAQSLKCPEKLEMYVSAAIMAEAIPIWSRNNADEMRDCRIAA